MNLLEHIHGEIRTLKSKTPIDQLTYERFLTRLNDHAPLTHEDNPHSHFCCFTLPLDCVTHSIFLVHHIKAGDWIPPGGHIDAGETPLQTVRREFTEELDYEITNEPITLFGISINSILNPKQLCKEHYDLWYAVETGKKNFNIDKGEFYDAGWFSYDKALKKIKTPLFGKVINKFLFGK